MERSQMKALIVEIVSREGGCMTTRAIIKQINQKTGKRYVKSPHMTGILKEMCYDDKTLVFQWARHSNNTIALFFSTPEQAPCLL